MEEKICKKCKEMKLISEFHCDIRSKDGHRYQCKNCVAEYSRNFYEVNKEKILDRNGNWVKRNPEKSRSKLRKWRRENRFAWALLSSRGSAKKKGYLPCNATVKELETTFTGKCHVCGVPEIECQRHLALDHNHETGQFRGWLCDNCNKAAGLLKESSDVISRLAIYVKQAEVPV